MFSNVTDRQDCFSLKCLFVILLGAIDDKRHEPFKTNEFVIMYSPFGTVQQSGRSYPHNIYNICHTRKLITGKLIMVSTDCMLFWTIDLAHYTLNQDMMKIVKMFGQVTKVQCSTELIPQ